MMEVYVLSKFKITKYQIAIRIINLKLSLCWLVNILSLTLLFFNLIISKIPL